MQCVSVIIPLYNKEKYILSCLESLTVQNYKELEVIVIDDGSTDSGVSLIENSSYLRQLNLKIIRQENSGPSSARNRGIEAATGEFILFLDADDYLAPDCIQYSTELINKYNVDMVEFGFSENTLSEMPPPPVCQITELNSKYELINSLLQRKIKSLVWGSLFKAEIVKRCKFIEAIKCGEDSCFKLDYILLADSAVISLRKLYVNRVLFDNTICRQKASSDKMKSIISYVDHFEKVLHDIAATKYLLHRRLFQVCVAYLGCIYRDGQENECRNEIQGLRARCRRYMNIFDSKQWPYIASLFLMVVSKKLYCFLYKLLKPAN